MLKTLLCIQHLWLVSVLSRTERLRDIYTQYEFYAPPGESEPTHIHFYASRSTARILFGQLPLPDRNKIRSLESVSFQDEIEAELDRIEDAEQYVRDCAAVEQLEYIDPIYHPGNVTADSLDEAKGLTAYWYYDDSPNYGTAIIYGEDPGDVHEMAKDHRSEMLNDIERSLAIYSTCEIRPITTLTDYLQCSRDAEETINVDQ